MTKLDLQKELLEKVKPGTKPSDIKKQVKRSQMPVSQDEGYESDQSSSSSKTSPNQTQELQTQLTSLKKQLQLYKDFRESDLKIKEDYKQTIKDLQTKNSELNKTIQELKNQAKNPAKTKPEPKTFLCSDCQQEQPLTELSRQFSNFSFCLTCSKQARKEAQEQKQPSQEFTCHTCQQNKSETPTKIKLDKTLQKYSVCSSCKPTLKEFNEADLITDDLWAKYPYSSASEILEKEFGIKKEEPW